MESAIASHLKCPRSQAKRVANEYAPPYPAWVARAGTQCQQVVMGYFGVQWRDAARTAAAGRTLADIAASFAAADGPLHVDRAHGTDTAGYDTLVLIAYWLDPKSYARWSSTGQVAAWWDARDSEHGGLGYFREILSPHVERFETLFSTPDRLEGIATAMGSRSEGEIQEHAYWGSMRERLAIAQTSPLAPGPLPAAQSSGLRRIRLRGQENLAVIRSGQEWTATQGKERTLYLGRMEPTLRAGMDFLRDAGASIGCYFNRYLRHVDAAGDPVEKSFGLSYWRSLHDLEDWAEHHPTHVAIFNTFMHIVQDLNFNLALRLYHEVSVLRADEQDYEYINCHPRTGMLSAHDDPAQPDAPEFRRP